VPLRNLGASLSPDSAWIFLQGAETLPLRIVQHSENALAVANHLKKHPKVAWVRYPGLPDDPTYKTASKYLKKGYGGMVVFGVKGGYDAAVKVISKYRFILSSGKCRRREELDFASGQAPPIHRISAKEQLAGGLTPDLIRLSIGIEHIDDILEALDEALAKI